MSTIMPMLLFLYCYLVIQQNTEKQLEDLKELQGKMKQMSADARDKETLYNQLVCVMTGCDTEVDSCMA